MEHHSFLLQAILLSSQAYSIVFVQVVLHYCFAIWIWGEKKFSRRGLALVITFRLLCFGQSQIDDHFQDSDSD